MANKKKRASKEVIKAWQERVALIQSNEFELSETLAEQETRKKKGLKDYNFFCRSYFPHLAFTDCADFQIDAAKYISEESRARALFEWARGHAKSTHISCLIPLWLLARAQRDFNFLVLVSKSFDAAVGLLGDLQAELANNEIYKRDFGISAEDGSEWTAGKFSLSNGTTFVALGRGQSPRGLKKRGRRPDYIIIDDIDDDELVQNEARVRKAHKWLMTALYGTMAVGRGRFILVGNRIGKFSILSEVAKMENIHHTIVNILNKKGEVSWKENYTLEEVKAIRKDMGEINFFREYMNTPITEGAVFKSEYFRYGKILPFKSYRRIVAYTDPSWKSSKQNDYKATIVVGKTKENSYHVIKAFAEQTTVKRMVAWHYEIDALIGKTAPIRYLMEANFVQDLLLQEFQQEGEKQGFNITITADKRKKIDKYSRIEAMQPLFERGEVIFNEKEKEDKGMQVLVEQLLAIEAGSKVHDDAPDALEGAIYALTKGANAGRRRYAIASSVDRHC